MRNYLIATVIGLSTFVFSQPVKANPDLSYTSAYRSILTDRHDNDYKNQEFRVYVLKWLDQDKGYPHKIAVSYCESRRQGQSINQIIEIIVDELAQRKALESWSKSRFSAYTKLSTEGMMVGLRHYCPEFLNY